MGLTFPDICLAGEENPEKTSPRKLTTFLLMCLLRHIYLHFSSNHHFGYESAAWSRSGIQTGPLRDRRACYRLLHNGGQLIDQSIIVFCPRAGLSLQTQHSPLYPLLSLPFRIFIQSIYHNVVCHLISSPTSNFLPIYHIF